MADRRVSVGVDADVSPFISGMTRAGVAAKGFASELESADSRMSNLVQTGLALAPAFVPLGAAAVPAIAGLTTQLGFAVGAAGTAVLAFQGIGDALDAVRKAHLEPTAENIEAMNQALEDVGPAGAKFVQFLDDLRPQLAEIQDTARAGMFPGFEAGIDSLLTRLPEVKDIVSTISTTLGDLAADAGEALSSERWDDFFTFLDQEARPTLTGMGDAFGYVVEGLTNLVMDTNPLADDFTEGMAGMARSFRDWTEALGESEGFREFVDYVRDSGPQALDTLAALGGALVSVTKAAAPVGQVALPVIEAIADALSLLAGSPAGPMLISAAAGLSAVSRAIALFNAANASAVVGLIDKVGGKGAAAGAGARVAAAGIGALALSMTDLDDKAGLANAAMGAMMGAVGGPWGMAIGGAIGLTLDLAAANRDLEEAIQDARDAIADESVAYSDAQAQVEEAQKKLHDMQTGFDPIDVTNFIPVLGPYLGEWFDDSDKLKADVDELSDGLEKKLPAAFASTASAARGHGADFRSYQDDIEDSIEANYDFIGSLDAVNAKLTDRGEMRSYRAALRDFNRQMREAPQHLKRNSAAWDEIEASLDGIASTAIAAADDMNKVDRINFLDKARGQFVKAAKQMGLTGKQARDLADDFGLLDKSDPRVNIETTGEKEAKREADALKAKYDALPKAVRTELEALGGKASRADVDALQRKYDLTPKQVQTILQAIDRASGVVAGVNSMYESLPQSVTTDIVTNHYDKFFRMTANAAGGLYETYAAGDVRNGHQPEIAPGSPVHRIWAEEETGGESYIPHANDWRRPRAIDIWERTGDILGVRFARFAEGGMAFAAGGYSLDDRVDMLRLQQQINQIRRDLNRDGKDALHGLNRRIARAELRAAQQDLRQARNAPLREARQAGRDFETGDGQTVPEVRREIREFRKSIKAAGGEWTHHLQRMSERLVKVTREYQQHSRALERSRTQLDELRQTRNDFRSQVAGNFRGDVFGEGLDFAMLRLQNDASGASDMNAALRNAARLGLDGPAFKALAASGDLMAAQGLDTRAEVRQLERLFAQRTQETRQLARFAGNEAYGAAIREQAQATREFRQEVAQLRRETRRIGANVEAGAERGVRQGFDPDRGSKHAARRQLHRMGRH